MRRVLVVSLLLALAGCGVIPAPRFFSAFQRSIAIDSDEDRRIVLRDAYRAFERNDCDAALAGAEALLRAGYPAVDDYVYFLAGECYARTDHRRAAARAHRELLARHPHSLLAARSALALATELLESKRDAEARPLFERARAAADTGTRGAAHLGLGRIAQRLGDIDGAYSNFQSARREGRGTAAAQLAKEQVLALRAGHAWLAPRGEAVVAEVELLLAEGDATGAEQLLKVAERQPAADLSVLHPWLAKALLAQNRVEEAFVALWGLVESAPASKAGRDALYRIATTLWNRDRDAAAARAYRAFLDRYPGEERVPDVLYGLARIDHAAGRRGDAAAAYGGLIRRFPTSAVARDARFRLGWIRYQDADWWQAATYFADLAEVAKERERDGANYWRGRSHQRGGRHDRAEQIYRALADGKGSGYYALLAQARLRGVGDATVLAELTADREAAVRSPEVAVPAQAPRGISSYHAGRWRELRAAGLREYARRELDACADRAPADAPAQQFLLRAYRATDGHHRALRMADGSVARNALSSQERLELLYPLAFWETVRAESGANRLDPLLVLALIRQESAFDPEARSPADARGLMQLLPATATRVSQASGGGEVMPADLYQPGLNIKLGTRYLGTLLQRFEGNLIEVIAAYNGGEAAVDKWRSRSRGADLDEFVENISFRETRDYVKRVIHNYEAYRRLYRE